MAGPDRGGNPLISIVVPALNEEENLQWVLPVLLDVLDRYGRSFELVVIDDGSRDRTADVVLELASRRPEVRLVRHPRNLGSPVAFFTGVKEARGEFLMLVPADLAIEPEDLPAFFDAGPTCDVVVGVRSDRSDYSHARKFVSQVNIFLVRTLFRMHLRDYNYVYLFRRSIFDRIRPESRTIFLGAEILIRARDAGMRLTEVEARYVPRKHGVSTVGRPSVILRTTRDLFLYWVKWALRS